MLFKKTINFKIESIQHDVQPNGFGGYSYKFYPPSKILPYIINQIKKTSPKLMYSIDRCLEQSAIIKITGSKKYLEEAVSNILFSDIVLLKNFEYKVY